MINNTRSSASELSPVLRPGVVFIPQNKPLKIVDSQWFIFANYNLFNYESLLKKISTIFTGFEVLLKELEEESKAIEITEIPLTEIEKEILIAEFHENTELHKGNLIAEFNKEAKLMTKSEIYSRNKFISECYQDKYVSEISKYLNFYKELQVKLQNYKYIINQELQSLSLHSSSLYYAQNYMDEIKMWLPESECPQHSDQNHFEHLFKYYLGQHRQFDIKSMKANEHHDKDLRATVINNETFVGTMKEVNQLEKCLSTIQNTEHSMITFADRLTSAINGIDTLIHSGLNEKLQNELNEFLKLVSNSVLERFTKATYKYKDIISKVLTKHLDDENSYFSNFDLLQTAKVELHRCNNFLVQVMTLYIPKPEQYSLYKTISTPITLTKGYLKYEEVPHYLAQFNNTAIEIDKFDWTNECKSSANYYICPGSGHVIWFNTCMLNVLNIKENAIDLPPRCQTQLVKSYQPLVRNVFESNKILYSLPRKTPFTIYCKDKTRSLLMLNGTGYVVLPRKCKLMLGSLLTIFSPKVWYSKYRRIRFHVSNPDISVITRKRELKSVLFTIDHQIQQLRREHNSLRGYDPEEELQYSFLYYWTMFCILTIILLLGLAFLIL